MILSKRERYIGLGTIAVVAVLVLDQMVITPYADRREKVYVQRKLADAEKTKADGLFARQPVLKMKWEEMKRGGLQTDASQAESQAQHAVLNWASSAGVNVAALKPERSTQENKFQVISFNVTGTGTMASISRLLWQLEKATIPVRVTEMQILPRKESSDDLSVRLSISTLCLLPDADKQNKTVPGENRSAKP